jgi:hypothetical protein
MSDVVNYQIIEDYHHHHGVHRDHMHCSVTPLIWRLSEQKFA